MKFFKSITFFLSLTLAVANSYMLMGGTLDSILKDLRADGALSRRQYTKITKGYLKNAELKFNQHQVVNNIFIPLGDELRSYIEREVRTRRMSRQTATYLLNLFNFKNADKKDGRLGGAEGEPNLISGASSYTGNGIVTKTGHINVQNDVTIPFTTSYLSNGIWGYSTGNREYALQCSSDGLRIIDVTRVTSPPFIVQFIPMPGGIIWRDVETHVDPASRKTFAYVGGQGSKGALWVVDLSYLSGLMFSPHAPHSNPIPGSGYKYLGYENYSHTLSIANGLLFLNTAGSLLGCQILDLMGDPMAPIKISSTGGNQRDCHDSFSRMVDGSQLLFSADGYSSQFRIHNITEIRTGKAPVLLGETAYLQGTYAHSLALTEDSKYMYTFDEFDNYDIAVYDISDITNPVWKKTFQWKGEESEGNSIIHNGHVRGNFLLAAYYQAGFRIFDITDPINPVEVGNYETFRDPDGNGVFDGGSVSGNYQGAWNLFGGLASGKILVSDMNTGTFILNIPSDERPPPNPPGAPSDLIGSLSRCSESARSPMIIPTLKWNAPPQPATGISDAVTSYVISRSNVASDGPYTNIAEVSSAETTYIESAGLAPNTYYYTVTAKNSEAQSNASPSVNITVYRTSCTIRRRRRRSRKPRRSRRPGSTSRTARIPELT